MSVGLGLVLELAAGGAKLVQELEEHLHGGQVDLLCLPLDLDCPAQRSAGSQNDLLTRVQNIEQADAFLDGANFTAPVLVHNSRIRYATAAVPRGTIWTARPTPQGSPLLQRWARPPAIGSRRRAATSSTRSRTSRFATLEKAARTAPETIKYNGYARAIILEEVESTQAARRRRASELATEIGLLAA